jgi:hypothetical protein
MVSGWPVLGTGTLQLFRTPVGGGPSTQVTQGGAFVAHLRLATRCPDHPEVVFLGAAVGQVAGVMQVNLFVPDPGASVNDAVYIGSAFFRIWTRPQP